MPKETENEETIRFVVIIFIIGGISVEGGGPFPWLRLRPIPSCLCHYIMVMLRRRVNA